MKILFNPFDSTHYWQPCFSQFCNITKGIILQKFLQTKKLEFQLVTESIVIKSENLAIVTRTCKPRLPILICSTTFVMSQNCEKQGCQWCVVKQTKKCFRIVEIVEKGMGHLLITASCSHFFNKTDFEQYLLTVTKNIRIKINCLIRTVCAFCTSKKGVSEADCQVALLVAAWPRG